MFALRRRMQECEAREGRVLMLRAARGQLLADSDGYRTREGQRVKVSAVPGSNILAQQLRDFS